MAVTVKKIVLWRKEVENRTGILANALAPLANAGTDIHVVMGYRHPGQESKAAIELYPVTGRKSVTAAKEAGFSASAIPALLVEAITGRALAMQPRRPLPVRASTWIFLWPRWWGENIQRFLDLSLTQTPQSALR
jgi:hypothetical protein